MGFIVHCSLHDTSWESRSFRTFRIKPVPRLLKVEYQVIFYFPNNSGVGGLWQRIDLRCTQRAILAFAAKIHNDYGNDKVITLCIKAPDGDDVREVYYWRNGEITTNWGDIPER